MRGLIVFLLTLFLLSTTGFVVSSANAANPQPTKKVTQQKKKQVKKPVKKQTKPPVKKAQKKVLGAKILSFIPFTKFEKCVGPDGKTAYAPKKDCDNLWSFWNKNKPASSNNNSGGNSGGSSNNNSSNNSNNNSNSSNQNSQPNPTPTPTPTIMNTISGYVFVDDNDNSIKDADEKGVANYEVSSGQNKGHTTTDSNGHYVLSHTQGSYQMSVPPISTIYTLVTPNWIDVVLTHDTIVNFGLKLISGNILVHNVSVLPCGSASCGGITTVKVTGSGFTANTRVELVGSGVTGSYVGGNASTTILTDFINVPAGTYNVRIYSTTGDTTEVIKPSAITL